MNPNFRWLIVWHLLSAAVITFILGYGAVLYIAFPPWLLIGSEFGAAFGLLALIGMFVYCTGVVCFFVTNRILGYSNRFPFKAIAVLLILFLLGLAYFRPPDFFLAGLIMLFFPLLSLPFTWLIICANTLRSQPKLEPPRKAALMLIGAYVGICIFLGTGILVFNRMQRLRPDKERTDLLIEFTYERSLATLIQKIENDPTLIAKCGRVQTISASQNFQQLLIATMEGYTVSLVFDVAGPHCNLTVSFCGFNLRLYEQTEPASLRIYNDGQWLPINSTKQDDCINPTPL